MALSAEDLKALQQTVHSESDDPNKLIVAALHWMLDMHACITLLKLPDGKTFTLHSAWRDSTSLCANTDLLELCFRAVGDFPPEAVMHKSLGLI